MPSVGFCFSFHIELKKLRFGIANHTYLCYNKGAGPCRAPYRTIRNNQSNESETKNMKELIQKRIRTEKVLRVLSIVGFFVTLATYIFVYAFLFNTDFPGWASVGIATLVFAGWWSAFVIYLAVILPFVRSVKRLERMGLAEAAESIPLDKPTLPRSKVYCGEKAFYSKKGNRILLYSEIAWVHLYVRKTYGITVEKSVIFHMNNGKQYSLPFETEELKWMLGTLVIRHSPNLLVGYGPQQKARYEQLYPQVLANRKRTMRIWGIVLMCIGGGLLIPAIINFNPDLIIHLVFLVACLIIGLILFLVGRKK